MCDDKITILNFIIKEKYILFGKFLSLLTHEVKTKTWIDINEKVTAVGIFNKYWKYLRDTTWQNWRKDEGNNKVSVSTVPTRQNKKWVVKFVHNDLLALKKTKIKEQTVLFQAKKRNSSSGEI